MFVSGASSSQKVENPDVNDDGPNVLWKRRSNVENGSGESSLLEKLPRMSPDMCFFGLGTYGSEIFSRIVKFWPKEP